MDSSGKLDVIKRLKTNTTFVLVCFCNTSSKEKNLKEVELIPRGWVFFSSGSWKSWYPPAEDYDKVEEWTKQSIKPLRSWNPYECKIISQCADYEQGKRHLLRSFTSNNVDTTEAENEAEFVSPNKEKIPMIMSENDARKQLAKMIRSHSSFSEDESERSGIESSDEDNSDTDSDANSITIKASSSARRKLYTKVTQSSKIDLPKTPIATAKKRHLLADYDTFEGDNTYKKTRLNIKDSPKTPISNTNTGDNHNKNIWLNIKDSPKTPISTIPEYEETAPITSLDDLWGNMKRYMDDRFGKIEKEIKSSKRSIQYDLNKKTSNIKNTLDSAGVTVMVDELAVVRQTLAVTLPITDDAVFVDLCEAIKDSEVKRQALNKLMIILGKRHSQSKPSEGLNEILTALMAKSVQGLYSAFGRETHGQKKNKFIDTEVYKELECVMLSIFNTLHKKKLGSMLSRWFSAYKDREGGSSIRKKR